jgi:hypothetical protein
MTGDVAMCLLAIERLGRVAVPNIQNPVVATANPHCTWRSGYAYKTNFHAVQGREIDVNSHGQICAERGIKKIAQEQLIAVDIALRQGSQIILNADRIAVVVYSDD